MRYRVTGLTEPHDIEGKFITPMVMPLGLADGEAFRTLGRTNDLADTNSVIQRVSGPDVVAVVLPVDSAVFAPPSGLGAQAFAG